MKNILEILIFWQITVLSRIWGIKYEITRLELKQTNK